MKYLKRKKKEGREIHKRKKNKDLQKKDIKSMKKKLRNKILFFKVFQNSVGGLKVRRYINLTNSSLS